MGIQFVPAAQFKALIYSLRLVMQLLDKMRELDLVLSRITIGLDALEFR